MSKQTAVEFLADNLHYLHSTKWNDILEQAKEMEKQQKATYWQEGYDACEFHNDYENLQIKPINNPYK